MPYAIHASEDGNAGLEVCRKNACHPVPAVDARALGLAPCPKLHVGRGAKVGKHVAQASEVRRGVPVCQTASKLKRLLAAH